MAKLVKASTLGVEEYRFKSFCPVYSSKKLSNKTKTLKIVIIKYMKISDFELFFFKKNFAAAILLSKKPNRFFKQYLIKTRLKNYICLNFLKYFTLLQQIVYFLQESVSKRTPIVFFFNEY